MTLHDSKRSVLRANLTAGTTLLNLDLRESASFDREGRLLYYFDRGSSFRRSLASTLYRRAKESGRRWEPTGDDERLEVFGRAYALAERAREEADPEIAERLDREILRWRPEDLLHERSRFEAVYRPVAILPPDRYQSVVVQATDGCSWNRCTFCSFYLDRPFAVREPEAFAHHLDGVLALLGRGISARRGIFLADGNALVVSLRRLEPLIEIVRRRLPEQPLFGFVDLFGGERRSPAHWRRLSELGLERAYIGMETGVDELLAVVNKLGSRDELIAFVGELKTAGIAVSLIAMIGLGGAENRERHRHATLAALADMALGPGDLIYLSPFVEHPGSAYEATRVDSGWTPMTPHDTDRELESWRHELRRLGLKSSRYDIREFIY